MVFRCAKSNWIGEPTCVMFRLRVALEAGGFRDDIYQLVDLDFWYRLTLGLPSALCPKNSRCALTRRHETAKVMNTRKYWLDQLRILTWLTVDPASPIAIRVIAAMWWLPAWFHLSLEAAVLGPRRWYRLKTSALAPTREFGRARRFRDVVWRLA